MWQPGVFGYQGTETLNNAVSADLKLI